MHRLVRPAAAWGAGLLLSAQALAGPVTVVTNAKLDFGWSSTFGGDWSSAAHAPGGTPFGWVDMGNGVSRNGSTPATAVQSGNGPITDLAKGEVFDLSMRHKPGENATLAGIPPLNASLGSWVSVTGGEQGLEPTPDNVFRYRMHVDLSNASNQFSVQSIAYIGSTFYVDTTGLDFGSEKVYWAMEWTGEGRLGDGSEPNSTSFGVSVYKPNTTAFDTIDTSPGVHSGSGHGVAALPEKPLGFSQSWLNFEIYLNGSTNRNPGVASYDLSFDIALSKTPITRIPRNPDPVGQVSEPASAALALLAGLAAWGARRRRIQA